MILFSKKYVGVFMRKRVLKSVVQVIPVFIIGGILSVISLYTNNQFLKN